MTPESGPPKPPTDAERLEWLNKVLADTSRVNAMTPDALAQLVRQRAKLVAELKVYKPKGTP